MTGMTPTPSLNCGAIRSVCRSLCSMRSRTSRLQPAWCLFSCHCTSGRTGDAAFIRPHYDRVYVCRQYRISVFQVCAVKRWLLLIRHSWTGEPKWFHGDLELPHL